MTEIALVIAYDCYLQDKIPLPLEMFSLPDRKEIIERLSDRLMALHRHALKTENPVTFITGIQSRGNTLTEEQLKKAISQKGLLIILTKKLSEWSMDRYAAV